MEAVGLYSFTATDDDELSFNKGDIVKILDMDGDPNWYRGEKDGKTGLLPKNYIQLKEHKWYYGGKSRSDTDKFLRHQPENGAFIIRKSETSPGDFSLSVKFGTGVQHFKILKDGAGKYFLWVVKFDSLNQLIEYHRKASVSRDDTIYLKDAVAAVQNEIIMSCVALYDFNPQEKGELPLKKGQVVKVIDNEDKNWWKGRTDDESEGLFPSSYVKPM